MLLSFRFFLWIPPDVFVSPAKAEITLEELTQMSLSRLARLKFK